MFNTELIDRLFAEDKDLMTVSPDSQWVIYKFNRDDKYEFRVERNYDTVHRFYLVKNDQVREKLDNFLREIKILEEI
jgi:hypothetical protein